MNAARPRMALALSLTLLAGCGGGGADPATPMAAVQGKVVAHGGDGSGLPGVEASCLTTGEVTWTGPDGAFRFEVPPGEVIEVRVGVAGTEGWDCGESEDVTPDRVDTRAGGLTLSPLGQGEVVRVEVEVRGETIVECWIEGEGRGSEGECPLLPDPTLPEGARAELEVQYVGECLALELEVQGLAGPQTLTALLFAAGGSVTLGALELDAEGTGRLERVVCPDELAWPESLPVVPEPWPLPELPPLPEGLLPPGTEPIDLLPSGFGPPIDELPSELPLPGMDPFLGAHVVLLDAEGHVLFVGFVPGPGLEPWEGSTPPGGAPGEEIGWGGGSEGWGLPTLADDALAWLERYVGTR